MKSSCNIKSFSLQKSDFMVTRNRKKEKPYLERDISWMYFNRRILQEATRSHVPLLERMAFLGIYSNNLDEFSG